MGRLDDIQSTLKHSVYQPGKPGEPGYLREFCKPGNLREFYKFSGKMKILIFL